MEADLSRYHQCDYRDRWRTDEHGRPRLTLRQIWVRVRHLPVDSAVMQTDPDWTAWRLEHHLLDEVRMMVQASIPTKDAGPKIKPHPDRPVSDRAAKRMSDPERVRRMNAALKRHAERERKRAAGLLPKGRGTRHRRADSSRTSATPPSASSPHSEGSTPH